MIAEGANERAPRSRPFAALFHFNICLWGELRLAGQACCPHSVTSGDINELMRLTPVRCPLPR